jgi:hypothetical protein
MYNKSLESVNNTALMQSLFSSSWNDLVILPPLVFPAKIVEIAKFHKKSLMSKNGQNVNRSITIFKRSFLSAEMVQSVEKLSVSSVVHFMTFLNEWN